MKRRNRMFASAALAAPALAMVMSGPVLAAETPAVHPMFTQLTSDQRETLQKVRELIKAGKKDEADALLKQAGIPLPPMGGRRLMGVAHGKPGHAPGHAPFDGQAMRKAIADNDFAAFQKLAANRPFAAKIDQAAFDKLVATQRKMTEARALLLKGDKDGARKIMDELRSSGAFPKPMKGKHGFHTPPLAHPAP